MTGSVESTVSLTPSPDGRLLPYGVITFVTLSVALLVGEPTLVPAALPFAIALVLGLRRRGPITVRASMTVDQDRVLEDDLVTGELRISWDGPCDAQVLIDRLEALTPEGPFEPYQAARGTSEVVMPFRLTAASWGRHATGEVWLRLTLPMGLVTWTGRVLVGPAVRVLPGSERLSQLLTPAHSRTVWGAHTTARLGDGHEFAELRPYSPGDRLRDLNWAATARFGEPIVNRYHAEVSGDVVIALEAYGDGSIASMEVLRKAARLSWAIASVHMRSNDRVGLVGLGRSTQWLPPAGGRLAQYRLMDVLLRIGGDAVEGVLTARRWVDLPSTALVIAITTLEDDDNVRMLSAWRAMGRSIAVIVMDPTDAARRSGEAPAVLAARLWNYELERRVTLLRELGVPVVRAPTDSATAPIIAALHQTRRSPAAARA